MNVGDWLADGASIVVILGAAGVVTRFFRIRRDRSQEASESRRQHDDEERRLWGSYRTTGRGSHRKEEWVPGAVEMMENHIAGRDGMHSPEVNK